MYDLQEFLADLDAIVDEPGLDDRGVVGRAGPLLKKLLQDVSWLDPAYCKPQEDGMVQHLLATHPADAYSVVTMVVWPAFSTPIHDHGTWGLVGVFKGMEREERFRVERIGDPDRVRLTPVRDTVNPPGSVTALVAPDDEVHRISNLSDFPSCSIHVYGGNIDGKERHRFEEDNGAVHNFTTRVERTRPGT